MRAGGSAPRSIAAIRRHNAMPADVASRPAGDVAPVHKVDSAYLYAAVAARHVASVLRWRRAAECLRQHDAAGR